MNRLLRSLAWTVGGLVSLLIVLFAVIYLRIEMKRFSKIEVPAISVSIPTDLPSIEEGRRLVQVKACADCHGSDLAGKTFVEAPPIGRLSGANLTRGQGSAVLDYRDEDWVRSIRFGVDPKGRPLIAMPAGDYHGVSHEDLGRMIAYLKTLPSVDRPSLEQKVGPLARVLYHVGQMPLLFPYEEVDFTAEIPVTVVPEVSVGYGKYLSQACIGCHGPQFSGGHIPGTPPEWADAKNITSSSRVASWSRDEFKKVMTEGVTPDGHQINPQYMPWPAMKAMTDVELDALFMFLKQQPQRADGQR